MKKGWQKEHSYHLENVYDFFWQFLIFNGPVPVCTILTFYWCEIESEVVVKLKKCISAKNFAVIVAALSSQCSLIWTKQLSTCKACDDKEDILTAADRIDQLKSH